MKLQSKTIAFFLLLLISCKNKDQLINVPNPVTDIGTHTLEYEDDQYIISPGGSSPTHILLNKYVYDRPDIQAERVWGFYLGTLVEIFQYGDYVLINGEKRFEEDLINGTNPSKTLNEWYNETERILEGLKIE
jgi:hypothetical protein